MPCHAAAACSRHVVESHGRHSDLLLSTSQLAALWLLNYWYAGIWTVVQFLEVQVSLASSPGPHAYSPVGWACISNVKILVSGRVCPALDETWCLWCWPRCAAHIQPRWAALQY